MPLPLLFVGQPGVTLLHSMVEPWQAALGVPAVDTSLVLELDHPLSN